MTRRVDPPYTRLFRGEDFDLTEFTLVLSEKKKPTNKNKVQQNIKLKLKLRVPILF